MGVKSLIKVEIQGIKGDIKPCWTFLLLLTCPTRQINHDIDVKLQNTDRQNKYLFIFHGWMLDLLGYPVNQLPGPSGQVSPDLLTALILSSCTVSTNLDLTL